MKRVTTPDSLDPEPNPTGEPELANRFGRVLRTARLETTIGAQTGTYQFLVGLDHGDGKPGRNGH